LTVIPCIWRMSSRTGIIMVCRSYMTQYKGWV
jgi:hypothetical protein